MKTMRTIMLAAVTTFCGVWVAFADDEVHGEHVYPNYLSGFPVGIILLLVLLAAVVVVIFLIAKKSQNTKSDLENAEKRDVLENLDGQIMSMLVQCGGELTQDAIRDNLDLPVEIVASKLLELEKAGEITKEWVVDSYTYRVKARQGRNT